jgi:glycosyltransferase involved in cell wall biosynthesis
MRIAICAYDAPRLVSGPNTWLRRIMPALRSRGIEPEALFITEPGESPTFEALCREGFRCERAVWPVYTEERIAWLLEQVAARPPDVFVPNVVSAAYYAAKWVRAAGIPTVGTLRSDHDFYEAIVKRFTLGAPDCRLSAMVCVSRYLETWLRGLDPPETRIARIPSGTPLPAQTAAMPRTTLRLVYVGRLVEEQKRVSRVADALCRAVREVPGTEAVIYGEGPQRNDVEQILADAGPLPVRLAGAIDSSLIQEELLQAHAIVLLSDYEGLPIALMEAMACGVVPIGLRTRSGVGELVEHGATGLVVDDRDDAFVAAVRRLREDAALWQRLSRAARAKVDPDYGLEAVADRWCDLLKELCDSAGPRRAVEVPSPLRLPPVHPAMACDDARRPAWYGRVARRAWHGIRGLMRPGN